jgi:CBS-domain-containing membrane protein
MSPRAACRLEVLGFEQVYDYVPGKADWLARGLPTEGENADQRRVGAATRDDVATAAPNEPLGPVRERVDQSPYGFALVLAADRTVLGRLRKSALEGSSAATAADVMEPGPSTIRADTRVEGLSERLDARGLRTAIATTPEGALIGIVRRADLR